MNIYKLSQTINNDYDTFDSCIVIAKNKEDGYCMYENFDIDDWAEIQHIKVELIGIADESLDTEIKLVCASFNA